MSDMKFVTASIQSNPVIDYGFLMLLALFFIFMIALFFMIKVLISPKKITKKPKYDNFSFYERTKRGAVSEVELPAKAIEAEDKIDQYSIMKKLESQSKIEEGMERYLKDDEKEVVNILKLKEGVCDQGTIVTLTGYSKAKVSEIINELFDRKIILKRKKGRKNIIMLRSLKLIGQKPE